MFEIYKVSSGNQFVCMCVCLCVCVCMSFEGLSTSWQRPKSVKRTQPLSLPPFPSSIQLIASLGKLLNCSNNIATDIDMCHLICIILDGARPGAWVALTLTCSRWCPAQKPSWHRAGQGRQAGRQASKRAISGQDLLAELAVSRLSCTADRTLRPCLSVCIFANSSIIGNLKWQQQLHYTDKADKGAACVSLLSRVPSPFSWGNF